MELISITVLFSKGPTEQVSPTLHVKYGSRSCFRNAVFSSYSEFRKMDKVHEPNASELSGFKLEAVKSNASWILQLERHAYVVSLLC
jgi:hypothetical protein